MTYTPQLTTNDNEFDPYTQFDKWLARDNDLGYGTLSYLGRVANVTDDMSEEEYQEEIERAIDEIIQFDEAGLYKKLVKPFHESVK